jgi:hypothetical protein
LGSEIDVQSFALFPSITNLNDLNCAILKSGQDLSSFENFRKV